MAVCNIPLYWKAVDCKIYINRALEEERLAKEEEEANKPKGMLPLYVVIPVQILSGIWKALVIAIVALPWWLILATFAAIDWILDWVFLFTFGLFCVPCAGFFIWGLNIALLPLTIWGWLMRIFLETFGLIIDGWLLFFKGNGCYLLWGHNCWLRPEMNLRTILDIPLFFSDEVKTSFLELVGPPQGLERPADIIRVRRAHRKGLLGATPIIGEMMAAMDLVYANIDF